MSSTYPLYFSINIYYSSMCGVNAEPMWKNEKNVLTCGIYGITIIIITHINVYFLYILKEFVFIFIYDNDSTQHKNSYSLYVLKQADLCLLHVSYITTICYIYSPEYLFIICSSLSETDKKVYMLVVWHKQPSNTPRIIHSENDWYLFHPHSHLSTRIHPFIHII